MHTNNKAVRLQYYCNILQYIDGGGMGEVLKLLQYYGGNFQTMGIVWGKF